MPGESPNQINQSTSDPVCRESPYAEDLKGFSTGTSLAKKDSAGPCRKDHIDAVSPEHGDRPEQRSNGEKKLLQFSAVEKVFLCIRKRILLLQNTAKY